MTKVGTIQKGKLTRANPRAAGQDIHSAERVIIPAQESRLVSTGLHIEIPSGHVGLLKSRSGLGVKFGIETGCGVVDEDYTGEVKVLLYNHGLSDYKVNVGDRISQLLTIPINLEDYVQGDRLRSSERGSTGFGDSGV